jgi:hypothetical protein
LSYLPLPFCQYKSKLRCREAGLGSGWSGRASFLFFLL